MREADMASRGGAGEADREPSPAEAYDRYLGPAMFEPWADVLLDLAAPVPGERVLDLACGTGIVTRKLAQRLNTSGRVLAMDINPDMLAVAHDLALPPGPSVEWRQGDACAIDAPDREFDLLLCQQGYQFFPDRPRAAGEMRRVLRENGRAVVAVWEGLDRHPVFEALFRAEAGHLSVRVEDLAVPFSLSDSEVLQREFEQAGFSHVSVNCHSMKARFRDARKFINLVVRSGAAVIPELDLTAPGEHEALLAVVHREAARVVDQYREGDGIVFPMYSSLVLARP